MQMNLAGTKEKGRGLQAAGQLDHLVLEPLHQECQTHGVPCEMLLTKHLPELSHRPVLVWTWTLICLKRHLTSRYQKVKSF